MLEETSEPAIFKTTINDHDKGSQKNHGFDELGFNDSSYGNSINLSEFA